MSRPGGGNGKRDAKRAAARENKVPSQRTLERRAKKAREAAAAEDYDNVGPDPPSIVSVTLLLSNKKKHKKASAR